jgi:hypothetical protein
MHVRADSHRPAEEVRARLADLGKQPAGAATSQPGPLVLDSSRRPSKLFLRSSVPTLPPAAEIDLRETEAGSSVVLRLMWGPLPAPFPRVVAACGALLAAAVLLFGGGSAAAIGAAVVLAGLPGAALLLQRRGEHRLQSELARALGVGAFQPVPH